MGRTTRRLLQRLDGDHGRGVYRRRTPPNPRADRDRETRQPASGVLPAPSSVWNIPFRDERPLRTDVLHSDAVRVAVDSGGRPRTPGNEIRVLLRLDGRALALNTQIVA